MTNRNDTEVDRFDDLDVEGFTRSDGKGCHAAFERDHDLEVRVGKKALGGGDQRALLLISLGIDEYDCDSVRLNFRPGHYGEGAYGVVTEAITALELIRQQIGVMQAAPGARFSEHVAFTRGVEAERASAVVKPPDAWSAAQNRPGRDSAGGVSVSGSAAGS